MSIVPIRSEADWNAFQRSHASIPILVQFSAQWCRPCHKISPHVEALAASTDPSAMVFAKIDIDEAENQLWEWAMVSSVPTFRIVHRGQTVKEWCDSDPNTLLSLINT